VRNKLGYDAMTKRCAPTHSAVMNLVRTPYFSMFTRQRQECPTFHRTVSTIIGKTGQSPTLRQSWECPKDLNIIGLQRETEEKAHQPEAKLGAIAQTRQTARPRNAKRSRTRHPNPRHGAQDRPKQHNIIDVQRDTEEKARQLNVFVVFCDRACLLNLACLHMTTTLGTAIAGSCIRYTKASTCHRYL
jgi:hypothetical protein